MGFSRILIYTALGATSFFAGRCFPYSKQYETQEKSGKWYLVTPDQRLLIENDQVGTLQHRIEGICKEDPKDVQDSLDAILHAKK